MAILSDLRDKYARQIDGHEKNRARFNDVFDETMEKARLHCETGNLKWLKEGSDIKSFVEWAYHKAIADENTIQLYDEFTKAIYDYAIEFESDVEKYRGSLKSIKKLEKEIEKRERKIKELEDDVNNEAGIHTPKLEGDRIKDVEEEFNSAIDKFYEEWEKVLATDNVEWSGNKGATMNMFRKFNTLKILVNIVRTYPMKHPEKIPIYNKLVKERIVDAGLLPEVWTNEGLIAPSHQEFELALQAAYTKKRKEMEKENSKEKKKIIQEQPEEKPSESQETSD